MTESCAADRIKSKPLTWTKGCTSVAIFQKHLSSYHLLIQWHTHTRSATGFSAERFGWNKQTELWSFQKTQSESWIWSLKSILWVGSEGLPDDGWMMSSFKRCIMEWKDSRSRNEHKKVKKKCFAPRDTRYVWSRKRDHMGEMTAQHGSEGLFACLNPHPPYTPFFILSAGRERSAVNKKGKWGSWKMKKIAKDDLWTLL